MCDSLCVRAPEGMWFAKSSDRHPDEPQVVEWHPRRRSGGTVRTQYIEIDDADAFAFVGSRPTWLWGVEHGVNEHGVAIGNEKIWTVDSPVGLPPALIGMDLVRLGLERATSADHAVDVITTLLERHGQGGSGEPHADEPYFSSFLVADPRGGWIVETSARTWAARPARDGAAISNRVTLGTDWTRASGAITPGTDFDTFRLPDMPTGVADHRLAVTRTIAARPEVTTLADIAAGFRSHGAASPDAPPPPAIGDDWEGFTVCMHRPELHAQTTASMIAHLGTGDAVRTWTCLGNPCVGVYVPGCGAHVVPELADEKQWHRFVRLRDRIEADPSEFAVVTAALRPVEQQLWREADAVAASSPEAWADFVADAFGPIDAALYRLRV